MGKHVFVWVIPDSKEEGLSMQRYKEDMNVHTAQSACATIGIAQDIIALDEPVMLELEGEAEETLGTFVEWSPRDRLLEQKHNGK